ncbi:S9 family peptidase [Paenibacillus roseipurpureus]|uniref:Prolyl oligopeptidase family serine peptidase n=1 Tax=Paenibacillus roseopurpureus TaxID=2918901 RepID=A0AA96LLR9_9BACL|nr:prolyl oligopeptidase family serine peptidase [Paenibacillus sp. MBLB1832]WNR42073.1 prolyl oligopeptidase family serine peptidase [Paenibacillus sp. MBLB1832]
MKVFLTKGIVSTMAAAWIAMAAIPLGAQASGSDLAYPDVSESHYASQEIAKLKQQGIVTAENDGSFHPDDAITRGDAAVWLSKALHLNKPKALNGFLDITEKSPYVDAVNALKEHAIVEGNNGMYEPDSFLTREQMASLLVRAFQLKDNGIQAWLKDEAQIGKWHHDDVVKLKQNFITDQITYMPQDLVTRAQLVLFLSRTLAQKEIATSGETSLDDFLRLPDRAVMRLSPDSQTLAYLHPSDNNRMNIYIQKLGETASKQITNVKDEYISKIFWITNNVLVYVVDTGGTENTHLRALQIDGSSDKDLTPFPNVKADLLDVIPSKNESDIDILVTMNKRDPKIMDVYRINLLTGQLSVQETNPGNIAFYLTDNYGHIRAALAKDGEKKTLLYREEETKPFDQIATFDRKDTFAPVMFSFDNKQLFAVSDVGRDKQALVVYDPILKKETEIIDMNDQYDVDDFLVSYATESILAVSYEGDDIQTNYLDAGFERVAGVISSLLKTTQWKILGSVDKENFLVYSNDDTSYGSYYYYSRKGHSLHKIADINPYLDATKMADMQPISFKSRDGLLIHGYLTLPKGLPPSKLPVVVHPHGGPWARDSWGFDLDVQLLASQGYAVLQLNYRGSTGYGKEFLHAGDKEWGRNMQNDITDGVNWLIKRGTADPERIAIYGASYGGYATLAGLAFTPDLYAAGVDVVGPSNLFTFLNTMAPYWELSRPEMYQEVGDPVKDKARLEAASPLLHADQIKAPLMIAQGVNDPRVNKAESDQMVAAMRQLDVDVPYMLKQGEGHGFYKPENERDFYQALIQFLNKYVKNKKTKSTETAN